jgi:hypothetical protein
MISGAWRMVREQFRHLRIAIMLSKYDRFTIAELFRQMGAQIGEGTAIIPTNLGPEPYLVKIGKHVTIAGGVKFLTHNGATWIFRDEIPDLQLYGPIIIDDNCVIGENVILMPNIHIGANTIISAGSVVVTDIAANTIAMGVPARAMGSVDKFKEKAAEIWQQQRPPDVEIEQGATWWTSRHLNSNREKLQRHLVQLYWKDGQSEDHAAEDDRRHP